jgi:hypothetical protein
MTKPKTGKMSWLFMPANLSKGLQAKSKLLS